MDEATRAAAHARLDDVLDTARAYCAEPGALDGLPEPLRAAILRWASWQHQEKRQQAHLLLDRELDAAQAMHDAVDATRH
jgi:hypothetical protein